MSFRLSVLLVARFLLRLREIGQQAQRRSSVLLSSIEVSHPQFASVSLFDSFGHSVDDNEEDINDADEENP